MCSPLLLLGRGPSPPSLPSCFASSHPGKDRILGLPVCPLRRGLGRKIWPTPSAPVHLWTVFKKRPCNQCEKNLKMLSWWRYKMTTSQPWNSRNVYEMEGALMGWPQTGCCVLCWNYHCKKIRWWGFVSTHCTDKCIHRQKVYVNNYSGSLWLNEIIHWGWRWPYNRLPKLHSFP